MDTGAGVNIITKSYAEKIGVKLTVGPEIRMVFADGRETTSHLQANVEFKLGEVSSSAKFRVLTNLLPGVDLILGKPWLKNAGPANKLRDRQCLRGQQTCAWSQDNSG